MADSLQLDGTKLNTKKLTKGSTNANDQMNGLDGMNRSNGDTVVAAASTRTTKSKTQVDKSAKLTSKAGNIGNDKSSIGNAVAAVANSLLPASSSIALTLTTKNECDVNATIAYQVKMLFILLFYIACRRAFCIIKV